MYILNYTLRLALKDTAHCATCHTPSLFDWTLPWDLSRLSQAYSWTCSQLHSQLHLMMHSQPTSLFTSRCAQKTPPIAPDGTLPASLPLCSQVSSKEASKHTPGYDLKYTFNYTWWHTPSLLGCIHWGTSPSCSHLDSHKHIQAPSHSHSIAHSQYTWLKSPQNTLKREDTSNLIGLYAPMYASACAVETLPEL